MTEEWLRSASRAIPPARIDTSAPNPARVWDAMNGGRDNFETDRLVARHLVAAAPALARVVVAGFAFRNRVVSYLAGEVRVRQFIDISMGMRDTATYSAYAIAPDSRVVCVVDDPVVLSHARATLRSPAEGAISYVEADPRDMESVFQGVREIVDLAAPVAVVLPDTLNFMKNPSGAVARIVAAVPSGSYLAIMQIVRDERLALAARRWNRAFDMPVYLRDADEVGGWFKDLDLVEPGVVEVHRWRPAPDDPDYPDGVPLLGAVARKR
jgi:S-adenosyl methyltransferase